jgi:hypothetical protein
VSAPTSSLAPKAILNILNIIAHLIMTSRLSTDAHLCQRQPIFGMDPV